MLTQKYGNVDKTTQLYIILYALKNTIALYHCPEDNWRLKGMRITLNFQDLAQEFPMFSKYLQGKVIKCQKFSTSVTLTDDRKISLFLLN